MTLLEIMLVVVILGIILAVTLPKMSGTNERTALTTTSRDMAKLAALARQMALSGQTQTALVVDFETNRWWVDPYYGLDEREIRERLKEQRRRDALSDEQVPQVLHDRLLMRAVDDEGEPLEEDEQVVVVFQPNGASNGGRFVFQGKNRHKMMTVEIEKATGRSEAYWGGPKTLAERFVELGADPSRFPGLAGADELNRSEVREPGEGFSRIGQTEEQRVDAYADAAARIMSRTRSRIERQQEAAGNVPAGGYEEKR